MTSQHLLSVLVQTVDKVGNKKMTASYELHMLLD
jgi:hypothetical protein